MRGYIKLISKGFGKIIFENNESPLITFPETFEDGDEAEISFRDKNMTQISHIIAYSKDVFYGKVIQKFNAYTGIVLVTYPKLIGTVLINGNYNINDRVKFKIEKLINGKQKAINIQKVTEDEIFKTDLPKFGKIEKKVIYSKEGVITDIVDKPKNVIKGRVKTIKDDRGFGFIKGEDGNDYFFLINWFRAFYRRNPVKTDEVIFEYQYDNNKRPKVKKFVKSAILPENKQFIIIDRKIKISLRKYLKFYEKSPEIGDIVSYINDNEFKFCRPDTVITKNIFKTNENFKNLKRGKVIYFNDQKKFGLIKENKNNNKISFSYENFKNFYKQEPVKEFKVSFISSYNQKRETVKRFIKTEFEVNSSKFKNFVQTNPMKSYYAYIDGSEIQEIYEYDANNLSESISCFKQNNDPKSKIEAIECMLKNDYSSKNITKNMLLNEKLKYLDILIKENLNRGSILEAIKYESKYQLEKYSPDRLSIFSNFLSHTINIIENKNINLIKTNLKEEPMKFLEVKEIKPLKQNNKKTDYTDYIENIKIKKLKISEKPIQFIV